MGAPSKRSAQACGMSARRAETWLSTARFTTAMGQDYDDILYCDIQMPAAEGRELLHLVNTLRGSKAYPSLDRVFEHMQDERSTSIDIVESPPSWGSSGRRTTEYLG